MRFANRVFGSSAYALLLLSSGLQYVLGASGTPSDWPVQGNDLQDQIQWDHYSIIIDGERLFLFGGEMHPFRLPVPELWQDILEKVKAMGMRMISIYTHWGFHAPTPDQTDFSTGAHNLTRFFEMAKEVGLYVLARPGPYINGELNAGGLALWSTTGAYGELRSNGSAFTKAWTPYQTGMAKLVKPFQLTDGGTVIMYQLENEYGEQWKNVDAKIPNPKAVSYMEKLKENAIENGIVVPSVHNAPNANGRPWSKDYDTVGAGGDVDIYGLDSYPQCWSCVTEECGNNILPFAVSNYHDHFQLVSPNQPSFMPEFQGGAMSPWLSPAGGCAERTGPEFVNFYYRDNIAQRITILNLYMIYGGTNWGWLAAPFLGSSYDYGAAISEDRNIGSKYYEIKNLGLFIRAADELAYTDRIGTGTDYTNNTNIFTTELKNPKTGARFYVLRHATTSSDSIETFAINVTTSQGSFYVPRIAPCPKLIGHESKIFVADFHFGKHTLFYATTEVLTYSVIDEKTTLVLWTPIDISGEFYLKGAKRGTLAFSSKDQTAVFDKKDDGVVVGFTQREGTTVLEFDNDVRVVLVDRDTAYKTWVPALTKDPKVPVDKTAIVVGPRLVRSASVQGNTISVNGDCNNTTDIEVFTSSHVSTIKWNGKELRTTQTNYGTLKASLQAPAGFSAPKFASWKSQDSLPETTVGYSDDGPAWVIANHTTTPSATKGTVPYLFSDEYGVHTGVKLWRGHFSGASGAAGVYLIIQGGTAHSWSTFLNGKFLSSYTGDPTVAASNATLSFANAPIFTNQTNVLLVVHDDTGHDQLSAALNPRGILNATLLSSNSSTTPKFNLWKLAGTAGGSDPSRSTLDPLRTHYNEGGLSAERLGWHLPGFDHSSWSSPSTASPAQGFTGATIRFYRTSLPLGVPKGVDASFAFKFTPVDTSNLKYRAFLYVNGYQYGRYYPSIASENVFPVPAGVLNHGGDNVIGLAVWAQTEKGAKVDIELVTKYAVESSFKSRFDGKYLQPGWTKERLDYA
ncbi:glycoside hydrolase superfamily [Neurospora crassa]|nr:glycoside hydrolase superfamily [Neurospora crassa]